MTLEQLGTIVAVFLGWFLNEVSHWLRLRGEQRKPLARAIADLLEIRHTIRGVSTILAEMKRHFPIAPDAELALRKLLEEFIPETESLQKRYNEAVNLVAEVDPILAFRLRSRDEFTPFLRKVRPWFESENVTKPHVLQMEDKLSQMFLKILEELILELAKAHGLKTLWRTRKQLSKPVDISKEIGEFLALIQESTEGTRKPSTSPEYQGQNTGDGE
jgi:hypothetical protein